MSLIRLAFVSLLALIALALLAGVGLRTLDHRTESTLEARLLALRVAAPAGFDPATLADLPEPARRYLSRAIAPGTPLASVVELRMEGSFRRNGQSLPMKAAQILAPPQGFLWRAEIGQGLLGITGSDALVPGEGGAGDSWTRFAIAGLLPVVRAGGSPDHLRSAGTRAMMEAIWAPASLLPQAGAQWLQVGPDSATVSFPAHPDIAPMLITLNAEGLPLSATAMRWSDVNPDKAWRLQPFGGTFSDWASFGGFTIPVAVEMGNHFGLPEYDRFITARITEARY